MAQRMSVTQALAELKLLRSRISSAYQGTEFIALKTKRRDIDVEAFSRRAKAAAQSFEDLVSRYSKLKSAIVRANATTTVKIADKEYTVAEAVERKRTVEFEKDYLRTLKSQMNSAKTACESEQNALQERLDRLLLQELGKEAKTNVETVNSFTESFLKNHRAELVDPLKLSDYIAAREKAIQDFETTVDWTLSESNGTTFLEIS